MQWRKETKVSCTFEIPFTVDGSVILADSGVKFDARPLPLGKVCGTQVPTGVTFSMIVIL